MNHFFQAVKQYYNSNLIRGRILLSVSILLLLLVIARMALPATVIFGAQAWLKKQGITANIEDIDFNIIDGSILLKNASGHDKNGHNFTLGDISIFWEWSPLSENIVQITGLGLSDLKIDIEQYSDTVIISGINLAEISGNNKKDRHEKKSVEPVENASTWGTAIENIHFSNVNLCYQLNHSTYKKATAQTRDLDYCLRFDKLSWQGQLGYGIDKKLIDTNQIPLSLTGDFSLDNLVVDDRILGRYAIKIQHAHLNKLTATGIKTLALASIQLENFSALQRNDKANMDTMHFRALKFDSVHFDNLNKISIHSIVLDAPGVYLYKTSNNDWEYQQWIHLAGTTGNSTDKEAPDNPSNGQSVFSAEIGDISVNHSDLCYNDQSTSTSYCLMQEALSWNGKALYSTGGNKLSAAGNISLDKTRLDNQVINRKLLGLGKLSVNNINIQSVDDIAVNTINIQNLKALQRSNKPNDHTLAFNTFRVDHLAFKNTHRLAIKSVTLDQPAIHLSRNTDGEWEHNKWLPASENRKETKTSTKSATPANNHIDTFTFAVEKLNILSDQKVLFTDNSVKPLMEVGLKHLALDAHDIDNTKPDQKITFTVEAQSTRHATLRLSGYALPFREKPSFDAKGKLAGFDLRAASPAARKAIGHIIKSGQLDADLKLLAKEGVLDSNISLTLHQFNLEATSKEDAEALDKKFGMPVNQSLVLLRDKDGSIHLDIPVTGDINNPDFDPTDAIIKATSKAATVTLITFYTPYGLIYAGGNVLFDLATAMDFEPVKFEPASSTLTDDNKKQLDNLARMLKEKPQLHLTLCGSGNLSDRNKLFPPIADSTAKNNTEANKTLPKLTKEQRNKLRQIALKRQQAVKNYLIEKGGISHDHLILCEPEYSNNDDAIAGVEINI